MWDSQEEPDDITEEMDDLVGETYGPLFGKDKSDHRVIRAISLLTASIIRLDKTSSRMAVVNIGLTIVILLVGIVQIILMLRGH